MTAYKGFVSHIVYRNEENSYTVFELTLTGSDNGNRAGSDNPPIPCMENSCVSGPIG